MYFLTCYLYIIYSLIFPNKSYKTFFIELWIVVIISQKELETLQI